MTLELKNIPNITKPLHLDSADGPPKNQGLQEKSISPTDLKNAADAVAKNLDLGLELGDLLTSGDAVDPSLAELAFAGEIGDVSETMRTNAQMIDSIYDKYMLYIVEAARTYGVKGTLIAAIIMKESGGNTNAANGRYGQGLMQIEATVHCPKNMTQQQFRKKLKKDPEYNIRFGTRLFAKHFKKYGNIRKALERYNASSRKKSYATKVINFEKLARKRHPDFNQ